jgi:hypothetical protein
LQQRQSLAAIGQRYTDIVWAAGLFEGEGCISKQKARPNQRRLQINMTDKDVMERFVNVVGYGELKNRTYSEAVKSLHKGTLKPFWSWEVSKKTEVLRILKMFLPHLGKRRAEKAIEAINHLNEITN